MGWSAATLGMATYKLASEAACLAVASSQQAGALHDISAVFH
jgi:hypothetical protein